MVDHAPRTTPGPGLRRRVHLGRNLRAVPWQASPWVALLGPRRHAPSPTMADVIGAAAALDDLGIERTVTPALAPIDARAFVAAGFEPIETLHLLSRSLRIPSPEAGPPVGRLRHGRPWHRADVLEIDRRAFDDFWRFDEASLREARTATPSSRYVVAADGRRILGYAVTGRAGGRGYLQRLAVDPDLHGRGIGTALVADAFEWLRARGADRVMVNTQERNQRALALYLHLGFRHEPEGLVVLERLRP